MLLRYAACDDHNMTTTITTIASVSGGRCLPVSGGRWPVWPVAGVRWPVAGVRWPAGKQRKKSIVRDVAGPPLSIPQAFTQPFKDHSPF